MERVNTIMLWFVPVLLLFVAIYIAITYEEFLFTGSSETHQVKLTTLIEGIESGRIQPNHEQVVNYLKASRDLEVSRKVYDAAIAKTFQKLAELLFILGFVQIGILFGYFHKKNRTVGVSSNDI